MFLSVYFVAVVRQLERWTSNWCGKRTAKLLGTRVREACGALWTDKKVRSVAMAITVVGYAYIVSSFLLR